MTDEYREVLKRWAAENVPANLGAVKIVAVELRYEGNQPDWSEVTPGEDSSFGFVVRYLDAAGKEQTYDSTWAVDPDKATRTMSQLLTELFRLADLPSAAAEITCERCPHLLDDHDAGGCRVAGCHCSLPHGGH